MSTNNTRKLPHQVRKDYSKMAAGEISEEEEVGNEAVRENQNNNNIKYNGGNIIGEEMFIHSDSLEDGECSKSDEEVTDAEVADVEKRLKLMRLEEKRLKKIEKYRRLSKEAEEVEKSIKSLSKKTKASSKGKKKVDNVALRGMKDVMTEVDKLMDSKVRKNHKYVNSSSDSSDDYNSSSEESDTEAEEKKRRAKRRTGKKSGKCKSGKDKKITSLVKVQEDWPHTYLGLHFINQKKDYEELTLAEFCAGYAAILEECSGALLRNRISHFKELMYLATKFQWRNVMNYHGAVLLEIERGHLQWGDNFQVLQNTTLAGGFLNASQFSSGGGKTAFWFY